MDKILDEIFSGLGSYGLILILIFGLLVWLLAHVSAQSGTSVSILWGLVTYTKAPPTSKHKTETKKTLHTKLTSKVDRSDRDFLSGKELKTLDGPKEGEVLITNNWLQGINERLEKHTDQQKQSAFDEIFRGKILKVEGRVKNIGLTSADIHTKDYDIAILEIGTSPDTKKELLSLHRGDRVSLRAKPTFVYLDLVVCKEPEGVQRIVSADDTE